MCFDNFDIRSMLGDGAQNVGNQLIGAPQDDTGLRQHMMNLFQAQPAPQRPAPQQGEPDRMQMLLQRYKERR